jgi:putative molybdopterin biosynthesis protein
MQHIQLAYSLESDAPDTALANPLMQLLQAVRQEGSILAASKALGLSYRHVWGEFKRWEALLGEPLLMWERGQAAQLTDFAQRLIYAQAQALARLTPQIEALQAELERSLALAFDPKALVLSMHASHDEALSLLRGHAAKAKLHLDVTFSGSLEALRALSDGRCALAGFHVRIGAGEDSHAAHTYKPLLQPGLHKIIGFVQRSQGLMVALGNPLKIRSLGDVAQRGLRFINRAAGTGTRVLLDELLAEQNIAKSQLQGYRKTEPSHQAAALSVSQGFADAALGIEAAAKAQGLGFVPLLQERYVLVCRKDALDEPAVQALLKLLRTAAWQQKAAALPGYASLSSGKVLRMAAVLPWWDF